MTHATEPSGFLPERVPANATWSWTLHDAAGRDVDTGPDGTEIVGVGLSDPRFTSQSDAESWVGEAWRELAAQGVASVTLRDGDRVVYGPMSLSA